jgi:hypothetical protein
MSDGEAEHVELTRDVSPSATVDLDQQWIAWLTGEATPQTVAGVDRNIDEIGGGSDTAVA